MTFPRVSIRGYVVSLLVCLLCGMAQLGTPAQGAPETMRTAEVNGTVSGYFLTPDERLTQRTLQLASGVAAGVTESLRPLRCRYHLTATLTAPVEIAGVRMETPDGATVWRQEVTPPARTVSIPREGGTSLLVRPVDGLDYEVHYRDTEGTWASVSCRVPGIEFLTPPEPAINWADLVRIEQLRAWLVEHGEKILPGLGSTTAPFALLGEDDRCVLVDHPSPPAGFHPYHGPNPTALPLQVGPSADVGKASAHGWATMVGGIPTVVLPCPKAWPEEVDQEARGGLDWQTSVIMVHEVCHCVAANRDRSILGDNFPLWKRDVLPIELRVFESIEREALTEAALGPQETPGQAARDFLALHDVSIARSGRFEPQLTETETRATEEGFAYFTSAVADCGLIDAQSVDEVDCGAAPVREKLTSWVQDGTMRVGQDPLFMWAPEMHSAMASVRGILQVLTLQRLRGQAIREAWTNDGTLIEAIAREVGYDTMSGEDRERLREEALERWQYSAWLEAAREALRRGDELSAPSADEIGVTVRVGLFGGYDVEALRGAEVNRLAWFHWADGKQAINVAAPCMVKSSIDESGGVIELKLAHPRDGSVALVQREGDSFMIQCARYAFLLRNPMLEVGHNRVVISAGLPAGDSGGSVFALKDIVPESQSWSVMPLWTIASDELPAEELPIHALRLSLTGGVWTSAETSEWQTVDLLPPWTADGVRLLGGAEYECEAHVGGDANSLAGGVTLHAEGAHISGTPTPTLTGPIATSGRFSVKTLALFRQPEIRAERDPSGAWQYAVTLTPYRFKLRAFEQIDDQPKGIEGVEVVAWPEGHPEQKVSAMTDADGWASLGSIPATSAEVDVLASDHCSVHGVIPVGQVPTMSVRLHRHFGVSGEIEIEQGSGLPADTEPTVEVLRGEDLVVRGEVVRIGDAKYSYETPVLPVGTYTIVATLPGRRLSRDESVRDACTLWFRSLWRAIPERTGSHHPLDGRDFVFAKEREQ